MLYNKTVIINIVVSMISVIHSSELLNLEVEKSDGNPKFVVSWEEMLVAWGPHLWLAPKVGAVLGQ